MSLTQLQAQLPPQLDIDNIRELVEQAKDVVFTPVRVALSKPAQRAYLTAILATFAGFTLLATAIIGYTLFYWSYVPRVSFERAVHLQYDVVYDHGTISHHAHPFPYGTVALNPHAVGAQQYDVVIELTLPRTWENKDAGNFMVEAVMFGPRDQVSSRSSEVNDLTSDMTLQSSVLARSRRPVILPYRSRLIELIHRISRIHWYIAGWRKEEEIIRVPMFEDVYFGRGRRNTPSSMSVEIQSTHRLQLYNAKAIFTARFRGLRWLMYNHRIISAAIFIPGFWLVELLFAGLAWMAIVIFVLTPSPESELDTIQRRERKPPGGFKQDTSDDEKLVDPDLSDTERTFPTTSGQPSLRYTSPQIKKEENYDDDGKSLRPPLTSISGFNTTAEADDEDDEDADLFLDSGIGTSMESSGPRRRDSVRKRRGRQISQDLS